MTIKKNSGEMTGLWAVLTKERNMSREVEAAGLLGFFLLFACGPLGVQADTAGNIVNSYKSTYQNTVDGLSDLLIDASESQNSSIAAIIRSGIDGKPPMMQGSTVMPQRGDMPMNGDHASSTPNAWVQQSGNMGDQRMGENHEDASSTVMIQIQLSPADIKTLQQFLNRNGFNISQSGDGSIGNENTNFGPRTIQAFRKFLQTLREHAPKGNNPQAGGMGSSTPMNGNKGPGMGQGPNGQGPQGGMGGNSGSQGGQNHQ